MKHPAHKKQKQVFFSAPDRKVIYGITDRRDDPWHVKLEDFLIDHSRISSRDKELFYRSLHLLVRSGVRFTRALSLLADRVRNPHFERILHTLVHDMEHGGMSFSLAMSRYPQAFSPSESKIIYAGEIAGRLEESIGEIAIQLQKDLEVRRRVKSAMMYPITVFAAIGLATVVVMLVVVPRFATLFDSFDVQLPFITRLLIGGGVFFQTYWWFVAILFGLGIWSFLQWHASYEGRKKCDGILLSLPIFGTLVHHTQTVRIALNLSSLLRAGVPLVKALHILAEIIDNQVVKLALFDVEQSVLRGEELHAAFAEREIFDPILAEVIEIGEKGGEIPEILAKTGQQYEAELDAQLASLQTLIEPIILVVVAGMVVFFAMAIMMPIFQLQDIFMTS